MHSNTITAKLLYAQQSSILSSSPSKIKRTKSKSSELNTAFTCSFPEKCNCCKCHDNSWTKVNDFGKIEEDWIMFSMDE